MPHYCLLETFQNCFYSPDNHYNTATSPELAEVLTVKNLFEKNVVCLWISCPKLWEDIHYFEVLTDIYYFEIFTKQISSIYFCPQTA